MNPVPGNGSTVPTDTRILVIEDSAKDLKDCVRVLRNLGVEHIDALTTVPAAILRLEQVLEENRTSSQPHHS